MEELIKTQSDNQAAKLAPKEIIDHLLQEHH